MTGPLEPGVVHDGRFLVQALAGTGGMSEVYRATDQKSGRTVALKIFNHHEEHAIDRFTRESELLAKLSHKGIVESVDHGVVDGIPYLAMEWLEGEDLGERLARGPLTVDETLELAANIAAALSVAHASGIVHRDVKPTNIFLPRGEIGSAKILDFGIARVRGGAQFTRFGEALGTPAYMAPEQARGSGEIDVRADVFGLGCVLFECLAGKPPFWADHPLAVMAKILIDEPPDLATLREDAPPPLIALIERMLKKHPSERPADGEQVAKAVLEIGASRRPAASAAQAQPARAVLTTREQKLLSVLFVARVSDTLATAAQAYQPTMFVETTGGMIDSIYAEVMKHGGWAERLVDGSIVVTLPGQGPVLDQAARAARCALSVAAALPRHPMALVTGRADLGGGFPVGDVIDRGVRLLASGVDQHRAEQPITGVAIDDVTAGLLDRRFEIAGREGELELVCEREGGEAPRTLMGKPQPFVGRDRALKRLTMLYETCIAERSAQAVLVTGDAGVGKSRLGHELLLALDGRHPAPTILVGRGTSHFADVPLGVVAGALSQLFGLHDQEGREVARHRVRARVGRNVARAERDRVAAFIGELCGVRFPDDTHPTLAAARADRVKMGDLVRAAWEELLAAELAAAPVVVLLEDLHLADAASVSLLDGALRLFADSPLFILGLARPEIDEAFPQLWPTRPLVRFELPRLPAPAAVAICRHVLGDAAADDAIDRLVSQADGNAFYLEELLRAVKSGHGQKLPETVLAMVQARLDGLDVEARRVLRACSIFGDSCSLGAAKSLLGDADGSEVIATLSKLVDAEFLVSSGIGATSGETRLTFPSALVREAAYATLTPEDRALGHRLAAEWLEKSSSGRDAAVIADHLEQAGEPQRAAAFCARAAELAIEAHDFASAVARAERGAIAGVGGPLLGRIRLLQSEAHRQLGDNAPMLARSREALSLLPNRSPPWWAAVANAVQAALRLGDLEAVRAAAVEIGEPPFGELPAGATRAAHYLHVGGVGSLADKLLAHAMESIGAFAEDPAKWAWAYRAYTTRAQFAGDTGTAAEQLELAIRAFEAGGDVREAASEGINLGFLRLDLGLNDEARSALRESLTTVERLGLRHLTAHAAIGLAVAETRLGYLANARSLAARAIAFFSEQGDRRMGGFAHATLARVQVAQGELEAALETCAGARELLAKLPTLLPAVWATESQTLIALDRRDEALRAAANGIEALARGTELDEGEALVRLAYAEALEANDQHDRAAKSIEHAHDRLLARANTIRNGAWRKGFLESVPENRRTIELFSQLCGGSPPRS